MALLKVAQNCLLLNRWLRLLISGVVYKSAGDNYWSAMSSTNLRCSLQIRGVIYRSSRYNDLTFYETKISHFTIPLRIGDKPLFLKLFQLKCVRKYILCTLCTQLYCTQKIRRKVNKLSLIEALLYYNLIEAKNC